MVPVVVCSRIHIYIYENETLTHLVWSGLVSDSGINRAVNFLYAPKVGSLLIHLGVFSENS